MNPRVAFTDLGDYQISTAALPYAYSAADGWLVWFETMIFATNEADLKHGMRWRCSTRADAELQHQMAVWYCEFPEKYAATD